MKSSQIVHIFSQAHPCKMKESCKEAPSVVLLSVTKEHDMATRRGLGLSRDAFHRDPDHCTAGDQWALGRPPSCASHSPFSRLPSRALVLKERVYL